MGFKKWAKKIEGGIEKKGLGKSITDCVKKAGDDLTKRADKINGGFEKHGVVGAIKKDLGLNPKKESNPQPAEKSQELEDLTLREHLAKEPMDDASKMLVSAILGNPDLTDSQLTAALLPMGNLSINQAITSWVQNHISNAVTIETLNDTIDGIRSQSAEELEITGETVQEIIASAFALGNTPLTCAITAICLKDPEPAPEEAPVEVDETPAQQAEEVTIGDADEESEELEQTFPNSESSDGSPITQVEELQFTGEANEPEFLPLEQV